MISNKCANINYSYLKECLLDILAQSNIVDTKLNTINYASRKDKTSIILDFWIGNQIVAVSDFWLGNFESDYVCKWLANKCHITISIARAAMRCIAGILSGYQIRIHPEEVFEPWRCICSRSFNQYLIRRYKYIGTKKLWESGLAQQRFCRQLPDTDYNREAISHIEYGYINSNNSEFFALKIAGTSILLSQIPLLFLEKDLYKRVQEIRYYQSGTGYRTYHISQVEFREAILFIYAILTGFQYWRD